MHYTAYIFQKILGIFVNFKFYTLTNMKMAADQAAPCIENRGIEDNFIFYIEYCLFLAVT